MAKTTSKTPASKPATKIAASKPDLTQTAGTTAPVTAAGQAPTGGAANELNSTPPQGGAKQDKAPTHITVKAKLAGFRRAGRAWGVEAQTVSLDDFSLEQVEALFSEPMLVVGFEVQ